MAASLVLPLQTVGRAAKELARAGALPSSGAGNGTGIGPALLIPFSVQGLGGAIDLGVLPSTNTPHELTPRVRVWYNFAGETTCVLEGRVDRATGVTGTQLLCLWLNSGVWQFIGTDANGVDGPTMPLDVQGDVIGTPVTLGSDVLSAGDVLLGLFTSLGAANAQPAGSAPATSGGGTGSGTGTTPIGTTVAPKTLLVGFSANEAYAAAQSDYNDEWDEMVGGGGMVVPENATETHLMPSVTHPVTVPADINFDFSILQWTLSNAQAKGIAAKIYLFEGANGTGTSGASPSWYNTEIVDSTTALAVMYAIIDGIIGYVNTNFPGVVVDVNVANEAFTNGGRNANPFQHFIGDTWIRLAMARVATIMPAVRLSINNDHTEDDSNTTLRNDITAFWQDVINNGPWTNTFANGNEFHVVTADATSIAGKLASNLATIFGSGTAWAAWSLSLWNIGIPTSVSELDVSDYTNDGPSPNAPATTIPLRDAAVNAATMLVLTAALTLPPGALVSVVFWQPWDPNSWLQAFLTPRQDGQAFRPNILGTVSGVHYARKIYNAASGANLFDNVRAILTSLPNIGSGSAAGTGSGGTGGATGGGTGNPGTGGSGTGIVGSIEPSGMTPVINWGQVTEANSSGLTALLTANGQAFTVEGAITTGATAINSPSGTAELASLVSAPQPSGLAEEFPAGQVCDPAMGLDLEWGATPATNTGKLYMRWRGMLAPNWSATALNAQSCKGWAPKDSEGNDHIVMIHGPSAGNVTVAGGWGFGVGLQGPTTQNIPDWNSAPFPASCEFQAGVYNTFEVAIYPNSSGGASDGRIVLAINGVVAIDTGATLKIFSYSGGTPHWLHLDQYLARAVYSGSETASLFYYLDQLYVSIG